jgi:hypothetical protein
VISDPLNNSFIWVNSSLKGLQMYRNDALLWVVFGSALIFSPAASSQGGSARASMERCVDRVLDRLARAKTPDAAVGRTIITECDGPLRATLIEAMKTGEARMCASVEACLDIARKETADRAKEAYRARLSR